MPVPNPLWGIHVAPGAITGALVLRTDDGRFELLSTVVEDAPQLETPLLAAALRFLERKDVRGRAAHLALPDDEGSFVAVELTQEEQFLDDQELVHELFERTPFEPSEGTLVFRRRDEGAGRDLLVAAMPRATLTRRAETLAGLDRAYHGVGLTGPAFARGAAALGLVGERTMLVDVQPDLTMVTAVASGDIRRYVLPCGRGGLAHDAQPLARDLLRVARYHADQERGGANGGEIDEADIPVTVFVGPGASKARAALAPHLGGRLATSLSGDARVSRRGGTGIDAAEAGAIAAAVGAALEAHAPAADRMALRPPPDDVPEYTAPGAGKKWLVLAAAGVIAAIAIAATQLGGGTQGNNGNGNGKQTPVVRNDNDGGNGSVVVPETGPEGDPEAVRALLDQAADRRALAGAILAARSLTAAAPPGSVQSIRVERARVGDGYRLTVTMQGVDDEASRGLANAFSDLTLRSDTEGTLTARGLIETGRADDAALVGAWLPAAHTVHPALTDLWKVRGGTTTEESLIDLTLPHADSGPAVGEALVAAAPPRALTLERVPEGVRARAEIGVPVEWPTLLTRGASAFLAEVESEIEGTLGTLGEGPLLGAGPSAPTVAPEVLAAAACAVRLRLPTGSGTLLLERAGPDETRFSAVAEGPAGSELVDHVPGASGTYRYRARATGGQAGPESTADVVIPVEVVLVAADPDAGRAWLRLSRPWRGAVVTSEIDVTAGDSVAGTTARDGLELSLTTVFTIVSVETVLSEEGVTVQVPGFNPDGRVLRGPDGRPVTHATQWARTVPVPTVRAVDAGGRTAVWSTLEK